MTTPPPESDTWSVWALTDAQVGWYRIAFGLPLKGTDPYQESLDRQLIASAIAPDGVTEDELLKILHPKARIAEGALSDG